MEGCGARVTSKGAILLGCSFAADAYHRRPVRIVTHAHEDHMKGLSRSVRESLLIIATPYTFRFLEVLGKRVPPEKRVELPYGASLDFDGERVTLVKARHIAGSAQVLVETSHGMFGYTSDFKMPGTPPLQDLDILVVDATYGSPRLQRRWSEWDAIAALIEIIDRFVGEGPVWIYGYNGKLQEVMAQLRLRGVNYPFVADEKTYRLSLIASEFYRVDLGEVEIYTGGPIDYSAVVFLHMTRLNSIRRFPGVHVRLTGWEMRAPAAWSGDRMINVSFSDHATFREIIDYVREARPKRVIVDAYRGSDAWFTAKYIEKVLGIRSEAQP
ncbi:conserved hypothetical protein [Aeropyrum pernix]|uniref:Metallo-beta-lactamase domain-containing protein n=1 Tax=Aeropyrum pernix TaxID=56636 RepID=A0A401H7E3_AERPX|nr:MBL fold metallo-hydrolase [Aeropyrum pernix]GBF08323.1 conserved hypothetical protein [Aeropyrum pernix]